jgi:hypothetical protein
MRSMGAYAAGAQASAAAGARESSDLDSGVVVVTLLHKGSTDGRQRGSVTKITAERLLLF